jgi:uncharacterized LabA/DUF88 family protein|nr:MAG: hypothetical protein KatS3mg041_1967 [Bacteroidota bacterium]
MGIVQQGNRHNLRVGVFVDTENLYRSSREFYGRNVNFESLLAFAVGKRRLVRATAYVIEQEDDFRSRPFIYKLSTLGYRVRRRRRPPEANIWPIQVSYHGLWDMGIAADILRLLPHLDVVVICSGNGHLLDLVEAVMDMGRRVEIIAFRETTAPELLYTVDLFTHLPEIPDPFVLREDRQGDVGEPEEAAPNRGLSQQEYTPTPQAEQSGNPYADPDERRWGVAL